MSIKKEFKKAVEVKPIEGLKQPDKFLQKSDTKSFEYYLNKITEEKDNHEQTVLSVVIEPTLKTLVQEMGRKVGRNAGGSKAIVRQALTDYFENHPELFE